MGMFLGFRVLEKWVAGNAVNGTSLEHILTSSKGHMDIWTNIFLQIHNKNYQFCFSFLKSITNEPEDILVSVICKMLFNASALHFFVAILSYYIVAITDGC